MHQRAKHPSRVPNNLQTIWERAWKQSNTGANSGTFTYPTQAGHGFVQRSPVCECCAGCRQTQHKPLDIPHALQPGLQLLHALHVVGSHLQQLLNAGASTVDGLAARKQTTLSNIQMLKRVHKHVTRLETQTMSFASKHIVRETIQTPHYRYVFAMLSHHND